MAKIKLTKGELKKQKDALKQYERYLPTLLLKKQQLQTEILIQLSLLEEKEHILLQKKKSVVLWSNIFSDPVNLREFVKIEKIVKLPKNIAGVDLECLDHVEFKQIEYDLFLTPLWVDRGVEALKIIISKALEIDVIKKGINVLRHELRITTQRVNLFEKVKIPQSQDAIRVIKIYLGDQMANAVGRSKIAKAKIPALPAGREKEVVDGAAV